MNNLEESADYKKYMDDIHNENQSKNPPQKIGIGEIPAASHIGALTDANKSLRRKIFDLYTIFEISRHLNSMLDVNSLLDAILFTCIGQMGVSGAAIVIRNSDSGEFAKVHTKGIVIPDNINLRFSMLGPLTRHLSRNSRPFLMRELSQYIPGGSDDHIRLKTMESELIVPLIAKTNLIGVLFLPAKLSGDFYHDDDLEFVSILVNQLSVALDNAKLYESEKKALEELKSAQKRLVETERLAALGRLSASIAHEVNNPLGIIKNYLTIMEKSSPAERDMKNNLTVVHEEVDRIAGIVKQLLDFYRPTLDEPQEINIREVIKSTLNLMKSKFEKAGIEIIEEYDLVSSRIIGTPDKLKQVFLNILINSRLAMPDGGVISVSARENDDFLEIEFADNGRGIHGDDLPRIFEPFYTTRKESGTGLGLAVCYGIIRSHDGEISAENNQDGGATFKIKLPLAG